MTRTRAQIGGLLAAYPGYLDLKHGAWIGLALWLSGCSVVPANTHWHRLEATPRLRLLSDHNAVIRTVRPVEIRLGQTATVRIEHTDAVVVNEDASSYIPNWSCWTRLGRA